MTVNIRDLNPNNPNEVSLVASRMRETLVEVLGRKRGEELYTIDWLKARVQWHIELGARAKILVAENADSEVVGHAIARIETDKSNVEFCYFSTIYVNPTARHRGIASRLINSVEIWAVQNRLPKMIYNSAKDNSKLIEIFERRGSKVTHRADEMVQLTKQLNEI